MCRKVKFNDIYDKQRLFENAKKIVQKPAQSSPKPQKNMTEIVVVSLPNLNWSHVQNNASSSIYHEQTFVSINFWQMLREIKMSCKLKKYINLKKYHMQNQHPVTDIKMELLVEFVNDFKL